MRVTTRMRRLLPLAGLALAFSAAGPALAREDVIPSVEAVGSIHETREPDRARISIGIEAAAATAEQATRDIAAKITRVTALLSASGVADADTESDGPNVEAVYEVTRNERGQEILEKRRRTGYKAVYGLSVTMLKIADTPALLPRIANAGGLVRAVDFTLSDRDAQVLALEERAVKEAVERARRLIVAAGARPGRILSIAPQDGEAPMLRARRPVMAMKAPAPEAEDVTIPVRPGRIALDARVAVSVEIVAP